MATLDDLIQASLGQLVQAGGGPTEQALFDRSVGDIQTAYQNNAQQIAENQFSRGIGLSTIAAHLQAENLKNQAAAIEKARQDAFLGGQQAQLSALGQAAAITQGEANRAQQAALQKRALAAQESAANKQLIAGGITGGVGAATNLAGLAFRPEIIRGLRGMFGLNTPGTPARPGAGELTPGAPGAAVAPLPDMTAPGVTSSPGAFSPALDLSGLGDFGISSATSPSSFDFASSFASEPSFNLDFNPTFDLSGLYDAALSPTSYDWSQIGWG